MLVYNKNNLEAIYKRYSDDILFIMKLNENEINNKKIENIKKDITNLFQKELFKTGKNLKINESKTEITIFNNLNITTLNYNSNNTIFSYLGFSFNGKEITLRDKTITKHYGKIYKSIIKLSYFIKNNKHKEDKDNFNKKIKDSEDMIYHNKLANKENRYKNLHKETKVDYKHHNIFSYIYKFEQEFNKHKDKLNGISIENLKKPLRNTKKFIRKRIQQMKIY